MYKFEISENLENILKKLAKKDKELHQKIDAPPLTKVRGLIGARFLDARSVPRSKERGFQTLRHKQVLNKINEIINSSDVEHYKNLRYNMKDSKRSHIGHFVLVFQYNKLANSILFDDFDHHDNIYRK